MTAQEAKIAQLTDALDKATTNNVMLVGRLANVTLAVKMLTESIKDINPDLVTHELQSARMAGEMLLTHSGLDKPYYHSPTHGPGKIVRDHIPQEIHDRGGKETIHHLTPNERLEALKVKLVEESLEVVSATNRSDLTEELSDLKEVYLAILGLSGIKAEQIELNRGLKRMTKGGFYTGSFIPADQLEAWKRSREG